MVVKRKTWPLGGKTNNTECKTSPIKVKLYIKTHNKLSSNIGNPHYRKRNETRRLVDVVGQWMVFVELF